MNTQFYKYAIEVARCRSITHAAENLYMAQPNLSKAIREIEESLGYAIFDRTSKGILPTKKGNEFLVYARNIVKQLDNIDSIANEDAKLSQTFGLSIPRGSYISRAFIRLAEELDNSKGINFNIQETNSLNTISNVADGNFQLGVIRYHILYEQYYLDFLENKHLGHEIFWELNYSVVMSDRHRLASVEEVEDEDLSNYIQLVHGDTIVPYLNSGEQDKGMNAVGERKKIHIYDRANQFELLSRVHTTYMLASLIPRDILDRYQLVQRPCANKMRRYKDVLIYQQGYNYSKMDLRFIDKLKEVRRELLSINSDLD